MKRRDLVLRITETARGAGLLFRLIRQSAEHELWELGGTRITIPRHREINQVTAVSIMKAFEAELGKGWWRR